MQRSSATDARKPRRPSPALVVGLLALFVALSGSALAIQANSVGSKQIRKGAVKSKDVKNGALRLKDLERTARSRLLFAGVHQNGTLIRGFGAVAAERTEEGEYLVTFERDVSRCANQVTSAGLNFPGELGTGGKFRISFVTTLSAGTPRQIEVIGSETADPDRQDGSFWLTVHCPR